MLAAFRPAIISYIALSLITGLFYPLAVTVVAQVGFPQQANGSLIVGEGKVEGSTLIGQAFDDPRYFWGRLSATTSYPYNASASGGSNLGPTHPALVDEVQARIDALHAADPGNSLPIPVDLVTSSASGLDPHISIAAALYQLPRIARARGLYELQVRELVDRFTEVRQFGVIGEPRVNVLQLNLALDATR